MQRSVPRLRRNALLVRGLCFGVGPGSAEQRFRTMLRIAQAAPRPGHESRQYQSRRLRSSAWQSCAGHPAVQRLAGHFRLQDLAHRDEILDIDAGLESLALAQERQILEHDIAGRAWRERATAEATERAVQHPRTGVE